MGTKAYKLAYLSATKTTIKNAIIAKGVEVNNAVTFRQYADKIGQIEGGGGIPEYERYSIVDDGATSVPNMSNVQNWFMSKVYIPPSVTQIGNYFVVKSEITEVLGAESVLIVTHFAFSGCTYLVSVKLPSVTSIGNGAFGGCSSLTNIDLGSRSNVITLGTNMRLQSDNLTVDSFLQVGNALVDNTGGTAVTIYVNTVAWGRLSTAQKEIFTNKNYTISVS